MKPYRSINYRIATWLIHLSVWLTTIFLFVFWSRIPDQIPSHYNGAGAVDKWGGKEVLFMLVFVMFFIYGCHFIAVLICKNGTTREGLYSKKLKDFVTDEDVRAAVRITLDFLAWLDASLMAMFVYVTVCSASCVPIGPWFVVAVFLVMGLELIWYTVRMLKQRKIIRIRAAGGLEAWNEEAGKGSGRRIYGDVENVPEEKCVGDIAGGQEECTYDDVTGSFGAKTLGDIGCAPEEKTLGDISGEYGREKEDDM